MLNPNHILITGASGGIGAALAVLYAAPGTRLSLHGRSAERLQQVAAQALARGAVVETHTGDVTDSAAMKGWIESCDARQPVDLLIANAGISAGTGTYGETQADVQRIFDTNLNGVLNSIHPILPPMMKRRRGQVAIMSSLASFRGFPGASAYCSSKAAVRTYGEALRPDLARFGVAVNVICPGFIKTPMTDVNPFPMPFLMSAERAARIIRDGLARNRARIAFPWPMYLGVRLLAAMPQGLTEGFSARFPRKKPKH